MDEEEEEVEEEANCRTKCCCGRRTFLFSLFLCVEEIIKEILIFGDYKGNSPSHDTIKHTYRGRTSGVLNALILKG